MTITVIVRAPGGGDTRLTFDGTQRIVIGRGPANDVRLPDATVSHRHATLRAQGAEFVLVDEGSSNGTFVGSVRIAPNTSRLVRSGDSVRIGRIWLELRLDRDPITRDTAAATHDLALALLSQALSAAGEDVRPRARVVEGPDQGATLALAADKNDFVVGRAPHCDLCLSDADVSREHLRISRRDGVVVVVDLGAKNGTSMGSGRVGTGVEVPWRPNRMVKIGQSVLSLEEPLNDALARIESSVDEPLTIEDVPPMPGAREKAEKTPAEAAPAEAPRTAPRRAASRGLRWSMADIAVMAAAIGVLALSLAGLAWLLRG